MPGRMTRPISGVVGLAGEVGDDEGEEVGVVPLRVPETPRS
jgi:hypothetical protein